MKTEGYSTVYICSSMIYLKKIQLDGESHLCFSYVQKGEFLHILPFLKMVSSFMYCHKTFERKRLKEVKPKFFQNGSWSHENHKVKGDSSSNLLGPAVEMVLPNLYRYTHFYLVYLSHPHIFHIQSCQH